MDLSFKSSIFQFIGDEKKYKEGCYTKVVGGYLQSTWAHENDQTAEVTLNSGEK